MQKRTNNKKKKISKKQNKQGRVILEFNLSKAIFICIIIGVLIAVSTIREITTNAERKTALAGEETENSETLTWVESTSVNEAGETVVDVDEEGNPIKVPIPKGYTASKVPGETSANTGLVIYEGDVDWSTILVDSEATGTSTNTVTTLNENEENQNEKIQNTESQSEENQNKESQNEKIQIEESSNIKSKNEEEQQEIPENKMNENKNDNNSEVANLTITNNETTTNVTNEILSNNIEESEEKTDEKDAKETKAQTNAEENEESQVSTLADETAGEITQTDINVFNLQKERNQYVWVPVKDISRIYGVDSNGKLWGKLYNFSSSGKSANNWSESTNGVMSRSREPNVNNTRYGYDKDSSLQSYLDGKSQHELLSKELENLFAETIKSIEKYGAIFLQVTNFLFSFLITN